MPLHCQSVCTQPQHQRPVTQPLLPTQTQAAQNQAWPLPTKRRGAVPPSRHKTPANVHLPDLLVPRLQMQMLANQFCHHKTTNMQECCCQALPVCRSPESPKEVSKHISAHVDLKTKQHTQQRRPAGVSLAATRLGAVVVQNRNAHGINQMQHNNSVDMAAQ